MNGYTQTLPVCSVYLSPVPCVFFHSEVSSTESVSHTVYVFLAGDVGVPGPPGVPGASAGKTVLNIILHQIVA